MCQETVLKKPAALQKLSRASKSGLILARLRAKDSAAVPGFSGKTPVHPDFIKSQGIEMAQWSGYCPQNRKSSCSKQCD
jgi:hypothetical protein